MRKANGEEEDEGGEGEEVMKREGKANEEREKRSE